MAGITIPTTQNVSIDYKAAGVGIRLAAFAVDALVIFFSYMLLLALADQFDIMDNFIGSVHLIPVFYLVLYFFFWEMLSRGRTVGKLLFRLRVIRIDGNDPTPADFLVRTIFLLPDVLLSLGLLAVVLITNGRYNQRLGDIVARTVVIHTSGFDKVKLQHVLKIRRREEHEARYPAVQRMTDEDMLIVKETLARNSRYRNRAHREAMEQLVDRLVETLELDREDIEKPAEKFLETLMLDYIVLTR